MRTDQQMKDILKQRDIHRRKQREFGKDASQLDTHYRKKEITARKMTFYFGLRSQMKVLLYRSSAEVTLNR